MESPPARPPPHPEFGVPPGAAAAPRPRRAPRATARGVLVADRLAGIAVRVGGGMTILAVVGILVFLVATVLPLFRAARVAPSAAVGRVPVGGRVLALGIDEYRLLAYAVGEAPEVVLFRPESGEVLSRVPLAEFAGARLAVAGRTARSPDLVVGTADGRLGLLDVRFGSENVTGPEADALRARIPAGEARAVGASVVLRREAGVLLRASFEARWLGQVALPAGSGAPLAASFARAGEEGAAAALDAGGRLHLFRARGAAEGGLEIRPLPMAPAGPPVPRSAFSVHVDEDAATAWVASRDGALLRIDLRGEAAVRREARYVGKPGRTRIAATGLLIGGRSVAVADEDGGLALWSTVPLPEALVGGPDDPGDGRVLAELQSFDPFPSRIRGIVASATRRILYLSHEDGSLSLVYSTNGRVLARADAFAAPVDALAAGPKDDGVLVVGPGLSYRGFDVDCPHPETNVRALFLPVHYEGYPAPDLVYQSSAASDESEPKLSLTPMLFGTLKATFYAMLFALPLALLGALYTSRFMHPRVRAIVKPGIEVMASLPSVVLGFVGGLVLAPLVEGIVPGVFACVLGVGLVGALAGFVWYLIPGHVRGAITSAQRLGIATLLVLGTAWASIALVPAIEAHLFAGSFRAWLTAAPGTGSGLPLLRVGLFLLGSAVGVFVLPRYLRIDVRGAGRAGNGVLRALAYAVAPGAALALLAPVVEWATFGGDFRWFLVGENPAGRPPGTVYDQRNSLVVGLAMGFAVIPIVYTIAEDALSAIPESLTSAALGCGASPWQAAVRVVLPAAAPGIFSATMIGLGRAVGETMIVLMAAGGTAIMDWSMFNGFRTLSANIATELPEAPVGGTLYRVLFLAALLLFALTFVLNTIAEAVRLRFRRKFRHL